MNIKLYSLAAVMHVSVHRASCFIDEINGYLPRCMPYLTIEEAVKALPIPFRKPIYIAAQLVKKHKLVPDKLPKPYTALLKEVRRAGKDNYYVVNVKGVTFDGRQEAVAKLKYEEQVILKQEPTNPYDTNAVMVVRQMGEQIGYIDRFLAARIAPQLDWLGGSVIGTVTELYAMYFPKGCWGVRIYFGLPVETE